MLCRYEDNGDAVNNVIVITRATDKKSVKDFGSPEAFLNDLSYLFGQQVFTGTFHSDHHQQCVVLLSA